MAAGVIFLRRNSHYKDTFLQYNAPLAIESFPQFLELKRKWSDNIMEWHTPYSCLVDVEGLSLSPNLKAEFTRMLSMFRAFHMRKLVAITGTGELPEAQKHALLEVGFDAIASTRDNALAVPGVRNGCGTCTNNCSVQSRIRVENLFEERYMSISFAKPTLMADDDDVRELRMRIEYAIHKWHSEYYVLIDCSNLLVDSSTYLEFEKMESFLNAFFCKGFFGHSPKPGQVYPFQIFLAKQLALENVAKGLKPTFSRLESLKTFPNICVRSRGRVF